MALLWVWSGDDETRADPMIEYPVGEGLVNEMSDVYLVQALLNTIYSWWPHPNYLPSLPTAGSGWDDLTLNYLVFFQREIVHQKKPDGIVSPLPPTFTYKQALNHKRTIAYLIQAASSSAGMLSDKSLVPYLLTRYRFLAGPLSRMRKGSQRIEPTSGIYEDARSGGDLGIESGRAF
jgi:hypothetical protein